MSAGAAPSILLTSYSGQFAGMEIRMIQEAEFLLQRGWRVTVARRDFDGRDKLDAAMAALKVPVLDFDPPPFLSDWSGRYANWVRALFARPAWLDRARFDLVHVFMPWTHRGQEHIWMAARAGLPVVISAHNAFSPSSDTRWHRWHLARAFRTVRGLYGVSNSALAMFQDGFARYIPGRAVQRVVYNFVDTGRFVPDPEAAAALRARLGLAPDTPLIGTLGRLSTHKRPLQVLHVFQRVRQAIPDAHCVFAGEGQLRAELESAIRELGLQDAVTLMGFQRDTERIVAGLDVHLLLSSVEGFGIATAEAMACAVPVVATRVPGSEEVIEDGACGWLVPVDDPGQTAGRVIALLQDAGQRHAMGQAGRARAERLFSRTAWQQSVGAFYDDVLAADGRG